MPYRQITFTALSLMLLPLTGCTEFLFLAGSNERAAHCQNIFQDGDETGLNCGGSCDLCPLASNCGDGIVGEHEECDDGNDVWNDECQPTCLLPRECTVPDFVEEDFLNCCEQDEIAPGDCFAYTHLRESIFLDEDLEQRMGMDDRISDVYPLRIEAGRITGISHLSRIERPTRPAARIPATLRYLVKLRNISVEDANDLSIDPLALSTQESLFEIDLSANLLLGAFPLEAEGEWLRNLKQPESIVSLSLFNINVGVSLNEMLPFMTSLNSLGLTRTGTTSLTNELAQLNALHNLFLQALTFEQTEPLVLPEGLDSIFLGSVDFGSSIHGFIDFESLPALRILQLSYISLSLNMTLALSSELLHFQCFQCGLTGTIEDLVDWSQTPNLISLELTDNQLTGEIPSLFPESLASLRLAKNELSGEIPQSLFDTAIFEGLETSALDLSENGCFSVYSNSHRDLVESMDPDWDSGCL